MLVDILLLLLLFLALGFSADLAVKHIKFLGALLQVRLFVFGILLGLVTSLPELSLGINTIIKGAGALSVGNLLGGIIVILGLVLGASLAFGRSVETDTRLASLLPSVMVMLAPIFLGLDGSFGFTDGMLMILLYAGLIFHLYQLNHFGHHKHVEITIGGDKVATSILLSVLGIMGILVTSHFVVQIVIDLLRYLSISELTLGLIVFSIGTNLPEISIAITSWRKRASELSLSYLLSSSFTNVLVLGILSILSKTFFEVSTSYYMTAFFLFILLFSLSFFYFSGHKLDRREGLMLMGIYLAYIFAQILFLN